jgi:hypothetical protein
VSIVAVPSERTRRISELEATLHELLRHPIDAQPYREELTSVEAELLELYQQKETG